MRRRLLNLLTALSLLLFVTAAALWMRSHRGGATLSDTVKAPIIRRAVMSHKGPIQPRKPFVIASVDAGAPDKDGKAVAFICRVIMGNPQPPAPR
jgi:hypothetical protein